MCTPTKGIVGSKDVVSFSQQTALAGQIITCLLHCTGVDRRRIEAKSRLLKGRTFEFNCESIACLTLQLINSVHIYLSSYWQDLI